ncbi:MAG: SRPBCC family protein [Chitinophagaceae bacterium]
MWDAWTKPEHLANWYGPDGFSLTSNEMEVKPGGSWRFIMHGPDGRDYPNRIVFTEVEKPDRLVYKHSGDEDTEPVSFQVTVNFEEEGNKTRLTMCSTFESAEVLKRVNRDYGAIEGGKQTVARLEQYIKTIQ